MYVYVMFPFMLSPRFKCQVFRATSADFLPASYDKSYRISKGISRCWNFTEIVFPRREKENEKKIFAS